MADKLNTKVAGELKTIAAHGAVVIPLKKGTEAMVEKSLDPIDENFRPLYEGNKNEKKK